VGIGQPCCAAKCRNQHRRACDWRVAAGVPGAKVPGEGDLPVIDGSLDGAGSWNRTTVAVYCSRDGGYYLFFHVSMIMSRIERYS
jgi:hypothetical protein